MGRHPFEEIAMEMGTAFLQLLTTMTDQSKKEMEYGREKKSVIRIWTDDQKKLLSYLNVDSWDMTSPSMSEKMKQLVEDKDPQRLRNVVDGWTQDWHGCVSYPALAQFMATGLMSRHQPGGFTLFMFKPNSLRRRTKDETEEMLRSAMGEYKVNDKILRDLAKTDRRLPMDIDSAKRQIQTSWNCCSVRTP
jgi:hypothetical protein